MCPCGRRLGPSESPDPQIGTRLFSHLSFLSFFVLPFVRVRRKKLWNDPLNEVKPSAAFYLDSV